MLFSHLNDLMTTLSHYRFAFVVNCLSYVASKSLPGRCELIAEVNFTVAGKQKAGGSSPDTDTKLASTGLTENQLQLSVEVCDSLHSLVYTPRLAYGVSLTPATAV